jgi:FtsZ-binding cell division protein ZapB
MSSSQNVQGGWMVNIPILNRYYNSEINAPNNNFRKAADEFLDSTKLGGDVKGLQSTVKSLQQDVSALQEENRILRKEVADVTHNNKMTAAAVGYLAQRR